MITPKKRKSLIVKYLQQNPLSNFRQIRISHSEHEYHSKYLRKLLDELIQEKKIDIFLQRYYVIPKAGKKIKLLINIIKSVSLTKPTFKKLVYDETLKNPTIKTIINNSICFYHLKLKLNRLEDTLPQNIVNLNFIKFLKTFSDDNYYTEFIVDKGFLKKILCGRSKSNQTIL